MKAIYQYSWLTYRHSKLLEESVNIGLLYYSKDDKYINFIYPNSLGRISSMYIDFPTLQVKNIQKRFHSISNKISSNWKSQRLNLCEDDLNEIIENHFLVSDASALNFSSIKKGLYSDLDKNLFFLKNELLKHFEESQHIEHFNEHKIIDVVSKRIKARNTKIAIKFKIDYKILKGDTVENFPYAWQNGKMNLIHPLGLDLKNPDSIKNKAYQCYGLIENLHDIAEEKNLNFDILVSKPALKSNFKNYDKALKIIENAKTSKNIIEQNGFDNYLNKAFNYLETHN